MRSSMVVAAGILCGVAAASLLSVVFLSRQTIRGGGDLQGDMFHASREQQRDPASEKMRCRMPAGGQVVQGRELHGRVDLVVQRHCEDIGWLKELSTELEPSVALFIVDQGGDKCSAREVLTKLTGYLPLSRVTVLKMPNVGRDAHMTVSFIRRYYEELAEFTVFVQAGFHWFAEGHFGNHGWKSQVSLCNEMIPRILSENLRFQPLVMHSGKGGGPVLATDQVDLWEDAQQEDNIFHFGGRAALEMHYVSREIHAILFGGSPCRTEPVPFSPGMQYSVRRDAIRARPCDEWSALQFWLAECSNFVWALERVTTPLFNSSQPLVPPSQWRSPTKCESRDGYGGDVLRAMQQRWGCELRNETRERERYEAAVKKLLLQQGFRELEGDCPHNDLEGPSDKSFRDCAKRCWSDDKCEGFSYVGIKGACVPKSRSCEVPAVDKKQGDKYGWVNWAFFARLEGSGT